MWTLQEENLKRRHCRILAITTQSPWKVLLSAFILIGLEKKDRRKQDKKAHVPEPNCQNAKLILGAYEQQLTDTNATTLFNWTRRAACSQTDSDATPVQPSQFEDTKYNKVQQIQTLIGSNKRLRQYSSKYSILAYHESASRLHFLAQASIKNTKHWDQSDKVNLISNKSTASAYQADLPYCVQTNQDAKGNSGHKNSDLVQT